MRTHLLELLACPDCRGSLALVDDDSADPTASNVETGSVACERCGAQYPIRLGVPRMLPTGDGGHGKADGTSQHFAKELPV